MTASDMATKINKGMSYDLSDVLARYSSEYDIDQETAKLHEREMKRYLVLCGLYPDKGYHMRGDLDDLWHTFLLFSRKYSDFCMSVAGFYIHHEPGDVTVPPTESEVVSNWNQFSADYEQTFREKPPLAIWIGPNKLPDSDIATNALKWCKKWCCGPGCC